MTGGRAGRVLVVDDEPTLVRMIEKYLLTAGLEVATCQDGAEAVQAVREFDPDVLVLELGDERYELEKNDSIEFLSSVPHRVVNESGDTAEVLWVCSPPTPVDVGGSARPHRA